MKRILYLIFLIAISCQSTERDKKIEPGNEYGINIDPEIVEEISSITKASVTSNFVLRYRPDDSSDFMYEPYDSIVPGIRFKFIDQETAYDVIDRFFNRVKQTNNYLYLSNFDLDSSYNPYFDIAIVPLTNQLELIKWAGTAPGNYDLSNDDVVEWFRKKQNEFDFDIIVADFDRIEAVINTEPESYEKLSEEIYEFCPDVVDQGVGDMEELVKYLKTTNHMWFWWD